MKKHNSRSANPQGVLAYKKIGGMKMYEEQEEVSSIEIYDESEYLLGALEGAEGGSKSIGGVKLC